MRLVGDWPSEYIIGEQLGIIGGAGWLWGEEDNIFDTERCFVVGKYTNCYKPLCYLFTWCPTPNLFGVEHGQNREKRRMTEKAGARNEKKMCQGIGRTMRKPAQKWNEENRATD